jgi:hypothetical protein
MHGILCVIVMEMSSAAAVEALICAVSAAEHGKPCDIVQPPASCCAGKPLTSDGAPELAGWVMVCGICLIVFAPAAALLRGGVVLTAGQDIGAVVAPLPCACLATPSCQYLHPCALQRIVYHSVCSPALCGVVIRRLHSQTYFGGWGGGQFLAPRCSAAA